MSSKKKYTIPIELQQKLVELALATDCTAEYDLDGWRESAICAARWLLQAAAVDDEMPKNYSQAFKTIAEIADKLRKNPNLETESDKLLSLLERHRLFSRRDLS